MALNANTGSNEQSSLFSPSSAPENPLPLHRIQRRRNIFGEVLEDEGRGEEGGNDEAGDEEMTHLGKHAHPDLFHLSDEVLDNVDFPKTSSIASTFKKPRLLIFSVSLNLKHIRIYHANHYPTT